MSRNRPRNVQKKAVKYGFFAWFLGSIFVLLRRGVRVAQWCVKLSLRRGCFLASSPRFEAGRISSGLGVDCDCKFGNNSLLTPHERHNECHIVESEKV